MTEPTAYRRIAASVRARISDGQLRAGDRAPSTRDLMREHGVASATAARALGLLRDQGLIVTVPRSGSVVADLLPAASGLRPGGLTRSGGAVRSARTDPQNPGVAAVTVAVALADTEGLSAVTIRRVAAELGVPTLALTPTVRGRDDLIRAMISATLESVPLPPAVGSWRDRLTASGRRQWQLYRRHRWLPHVVSLNRPQPVGALLEFGEFDLAALQEVEPDPVARMDLHIVFTAFVRGLATDLAAEEQALADTGMDSDAWTSVDPALAKVFRQHAGPALRAIGEYPYDVDRVFERGLAAVLDGFGTRLR